MFTNKGNSIFLKQNKSGFYGNSGDFQWYREPNVTICVLFIQKDT